MSGWNKIAQSKKGPNSTSMAQALQAWACGQPQDDLTSQKTLQALTSIDINYLEGSHNRYYRFTQHNTLELKFLCKPGSREHPENPTSYPNDAIAVIVSIPHQAYQDHTGPAQTPADKLTSILEKKHTILGLDTTNIRLEATDSLKAYQKEKENETAREQYNEQIQNLLDRMQELTTEVNDDTTEALYSLLENLSQNQARALSSENAAIIHNINNALDDKNSANDNPYDNLAADHPKLKVVMNLVVMTAVVNYGEGFLTHGPVAADVTPIKPSLPTAELEPYMKRTMDTAQQCRGNWLFKILISLAHTLGLRPNKTKTAKALRACSLFKPVTATPAAIRATAPAAA